MTGVVRKLTAPGGVLRPTKLCSLSRRSTGLKQSRLIFRLQCCTVKKFDAVWARDVCRRDAATVARVRRVGRSPRSYIAAPRVANSHVATLPQVTRYNRPDSEPLSGRMHDPVVFRPMPFASARWRPRNPRSSAAVQSCIHLCFDAAQATTAWKRARPRRPLDRCDACRSQVNFHVPQVRTVPRRGPSAGAPAANRFEGARASGVGLGPKFGRG